MTVSSPSPSSQFTPPAVHKNLLELVGDTPLVELENINPNPAVSIYAKLEGQNPSGSIKDRIALNMVESAEREGKLTDDRVLLEPSSGNTAIALAMISRIKDYELTIVMPSNVSEERMEVLRGFDVNIIESPPEEGTNGSVFKARRLNKENDHYLMLDQYSNPANPGAHYKGTGREIVDAVPKIDYFIAGLGTGGTLMGAGRAIREENNNVKLVALQPEPEEGLSGLRNLEDGFIPEIIDMSFLDGNELIRNEVAFEFVKKLALEEGIFSGISCGAAVAKCVKYAKKIDRGTIVTVLPDGGWKYISQRLWSRPLDKLDGTVDGPLW
ncbi:MAG: PLP-dependent cysteine synthase family protein [bacterium]